MNKVSNGLDFSSGLLSVSDRPKTSSNLFLPNIPKDILMTRSTILSDHISSADIWTKQKAHIIPSNKGYLLFDDTVIDKTTLPKLKWFVASTAVIQAESSKGIGVVTCVYVNQK